MGRGRHPSPGTDDHCHTGTARHADYFAQKRGYLHANFNCDSDCHTCYNTYPYSSSSFNPKS